MNEKHKIKELVNVIEELLKRLHYLNSDKLNVLFLLCIILLQIAGMLAMGINNLLLSAICASWGIMFLIIIEHVYRQEKKWYRKWTIYRSAMTVSSEGALFYEGDEKRYGQLARAME